MLEGKKGFNAWEKKVFAGGGDGRGEHGIGKNSKIESFGSFCHTVLHPFTCCNCVVILTSKLIYLNWSLNVL